MRINSCSLKFPLLFRANRISNMQAEYLNAQLNKNKNIDIICHDGSDLDAVTSASAMSDWLKAKGIQSRIIVSQDIRDLKVDKNNYNFVEMKDIKLQDKTDSVLCVDFSKQDRVPVNVLNHIKKAKNIVCIDHHKNPDLLEGNSINIVRPIDDYNAVRSKAPIYVDSSAKSATSVIYRFFEALNEPVDNKTAYNLFYGLADDCSKKGLIRCNGEKGTVSASKELRKDKNAYEIYCTLKKMLTHTQICTIAKNIDVISSLTPQEKKFRDSLIQRLQFSDNKKIAYVEIPANDKEWEKLGYDNPRTSTILNRFRQDVLANKYNLDELKDIEGVFCFYRTANAYRISAHTKNNNLLKFFQYVSDTKIPDFADNSGGHSSRGGGKIQTTDPKICSQWVHNIISCSEFFDN